LCYIERFTFANLVAEFFLNKTIEQLIFWQLIPPRHQQQFIQNNFWQI